MFTTERSHRGALTMTVLSSRTSLWTAVSTCGTLNPILSDKGLRQHQQNPISVMSFNGYDRSDPSLFGCTLFRLYFNTELSSKSVFMFCLRFWSTSHRDGCEIISRRTGVRCSTKVKRDVWSEDKKLENKPFYFVIILLTFLIIQFG